MPRITAEYVQTYGNYYDDISIIPDAGVTVKVEAYTGVEWVEDSKSPMTESGTVFARNTTLRLTPTGGGAWVGDGKGGE